jgi:hypothetical protein
MERTLAYTMSPALDSSVLSGCRAISQMYSISLLHSSGGGTCGMGQWRDSCEGSGIWKEQSMTKTTRPPWTARTLRVAYVRPSRSRST